MSKNTVGTTEEKKKERKKEKFDNTREKHFTHARTRI